jgi:hypothetical protein
MGDSVYRITTSRIELLLDKRARSVQRIRIETSPDLVTWTSLRTIAAKDQPPSVPYGETGYRGKVFFRFNPSDFALVYPFFIRFVDISGGVDVATSDPLMVVDPQGAKSVLEIAGTAPNGATVADSVHLRLPSTLKIRVDNVNAAAVDLKMATDNTGPERTIEQDQYFAQEGRFTDIYLRGQGGTCSFLLQVAVYEFPS